MLTDADEIYSTKKKMNIHIHKQRTTKMQGKLQKPCTKKLETSLLTIYLNKTSNSSSSYFTNDNYLNRSPLLMQKYNNTQTSAVSLVNQWKQFYTAKPWQKKNASKFVNMLTK